MFSVPAWARYLLKSSAFSRRTVTPTILTKLAEISPYETLALVTAWILVRRGVASQLFLLSLFCRR
jgi:hypothetical protein